MNNEKWNGTGLPPVGATVEYNADGAWCVCEIVGIRENWAIYWDSILSEAGKLLAGDCRPIRTEEEKQREADKKALKEIICTDSIVEAILDAGFTRGGGDE